MFFGKTLMMEFQIRENSCYKNLMEKIYEKSEKVFRSFPLYRFVNPMY